MYEFSTEKLSTNSLSKINKLPFHISSGSDIAFKVKDNCILFKYHTHGKWSRANPKAYFTNTYCSCTHFKSYRIEPFLTYLEFR